MYPEGFQTWVEVEELSRRFEGEHRPGHFRGVATVCTKLFAIVRPDRAYFGEKDAQQAAVVDRLVRDLALGLEIRVVPTVRDRDGLAVSSRNARLSAGGAPGRSGASARPLGRQARLPARRGSDRGSARPILDEEPLLEPEYVEVARFDGSAPILAAAVRAGRDAADRQRPAGRSPE